jgi:hypothetical protein
MIWSKQFYQLRCARVVQGRPGATAATPPNASTAQLRMAHLNNADRHVRADKWEYPWYAAWDLAFHCIPLALVDAEFAKANSCI